MTDDKNKMPKENKPTDKKKDEEPEGTLPGDGYYS